eukprot:2887715-Ditylum_brightwellii.AAC.1
MTAKAATMPTKIVTVIGKKENAIVLVTMASHIMCRKSEVALAPNLRVASTVTVALQDTAAFQAATTL